MSRFDGWVPGVPTPGLNDYQRIATSAAFYPGHGSGLGLAYVALKMNGEAGEFAEHVGKAMRDDVGFVQEEESRDRHDFSFRGSGRVGQGLTPERHALLVKEAGDVLWYIAAACNELGITLEQAAQANLEKLYDRDQRGVMRGSGDSR